MAKLRMSNPEKAAVNNSIARPVGREMFLDQITKADPFQSLYSIKPEVLKAIRSDMEAHGFDHSKPVNVWNRDDGSRILVDGYTRVLAAEEAGLLTVTAFESSFTDEASALAYAVHMQRDRRNLTDAELLGLVEKIDNPMAGFKGHHSRNVAQLAGASKKTAEDTAKTVGVSVRQIEKIRAVLRHPEEAVAVRKGEKTINKAEKDAKLKRQHAAKLAGGDGMSEEKLASGLQHPRPLPTSPIAPNPLEAAEMLKAWVAHSSVSYAEGVKQTLTALNICHLLDDESRRIIESALEPVRGSS
jgi:ParB family chromosome partitioning protein